MTILTPVDVSRESLENRVKAKALELGFDAVGIARADVPLDTEFEHYRRFVEAGMHGEMEYLSDEGTRRRLDQETILKGAKSVVCVARSYQRLAGDETGDPELAKRIARYARGRDYHNFIRKKLRRLAVFLRTLGTDTSPVEARPVCDAVPVLERAWAARAGLGFVGKNGLIIVPGRGSLVLLGEVVTTLDLLPSPRVEERCGSCRRCLDACPTAAFVAPYVLDPRKCISYLTIESRKAPPTELRKPMGEHLFGCDDCQTVCPFNASPRPRASNTDPFRPHARWGEVGLLDLVRMSEERWSELSDGTPVFRATRAGMARNAAIVLGNSAGPDALSALTQAAAEDESSVVREAAGWAAVQVAKFGSTR